MLNKRPNFNLNILSLIFGILILPFAYSSIVDTAFAEISCSFTQITHSTAPTYNSDAVISGDGSTVVIASTGDLAGNNPDLNSELFLYDVSSMRTKQITNTTNIFRFVFRPNISNDGKRVTFQSTANITPPGTNPDEKNEPYLYDSATDRITQIINIDYMGFINQDLSSNGRKAVVSYRNMIIFDLSSFPYSDTRIVGGNSPSINSDGSLITFVSNSSGLGPDNEDQNDEIFLYNSNTNRYTQITRTTTVLSRFPIISSDGTHIVFISEADLIEDNPDGSQEKFIYDIDSGRFIQITNTEDTTPGYSKNYSINANGSRVVYEDDGKIILYDEVLRGNVEVVSRGLYPSINGNGSKIAFISSLNLTGENSDRNGEVFIADCTPVPPPRSCEVRTLQGPGGTLTLPFPNFVPLCRCFENRVFREFRCALLNPDFFLVFRAPLPIFANNPFEMSWSLIPLSDKMGNISVETKLPTSFNLKGKKSAVVKFPHNIAVDTQARENLQFIAPNSDGDYPLEGRLRIMGNKGEAVLDQIIEFNVPVTKVESQK